jgi:2-polyprenyl-6-hydroxyphenyl methylase/3-demethylubiquinone-9 3-methyltransferase
MCPAGQAWWLGVFSTINRNAKAFALAIVAAEYMLKMIPKGTHEYAKLLRPSELARFAREAGLDVQGSKGMEHNPISGRYWLSNDTSVNYMLATRRPQE